MRVLAVDTATPRVGAAFVDSETMRVVEHGAVDPRRHAELLTPLIKRVLGDAGVALADVDLIVAGVGPGPYTGLRVGVVTAVTFGMALGTQVVGVCTLDAFAHDARATIPGSVVVATDARRREVYWARYDAVGLRTFGPLVSKPDVVREREPESLIVGSAASHVDGRVIDTDIRVAALAEVAISALARGEELPALDVAEHLSDMAGDGSGTVPATTLLLPRPLYLRHPDAQVPLALRGAST